MLEYFESPADKRNWFVLLSGNEDEGCGLTVALLLLLVLFKESVGESIESQDYVFCNIRR